MTTITREQLIKKAQEQIAFCRDTKVTGEGRAHVDQCAALFEIALAAIDSEPVAWLWSRDGDAERDVSLTPPDDDDDAAMLNHPSSIQPNTDAAPSTEIKHPSSNSPVIGIDLASGPDRTVEVRYVAPPGYVMVPKEPTKEMIDAGWLHFMGTKNPSSKGTYKAMLAAAPHDTPALNSLQSVDSVAGKWIPVSERMPKRGDYLVTDGRDFDVQTFDSEQFIPGFVWDDGITHWMPLPAAPQEVKGE